MGDDVHEVRGRLARTLAHVEEDTPAAGEHRVREVAAANAWRARHGLPPLSTTPSRPELELHERARALGLLS